MEISHIRGITLIEVYVISPFIFQVYLKEEDSLILDKLDSIDGIHFYGYRDIIDKKIEVIFKSIESKPFEDYYFDKENN